MLAAAALAWPGGAGPAGLLPPERLAAILPAAWLGCCIVCAGRPGAWQSLGLALPALAAASCLAPEGLTTLPGLLTAAVAGAWWWHAQPAPAENHAGATRVLIATGLLFVPGLLAALGHSVGVTPAIPAALTPVGGGAPTPWSLTPIALAGTVIWWRHRAVEQPA